MSDYSNMVVPSYLRPSVLTDAATAGIGGVQHPRLSIRASRFRIMEDGGEEVLDTLALMLVIVGANPAISKDFYANVFSEDDAAAPDCWSNNGVVPDVSVTHPQNNLCASCPKNAWGSKITPKGKETKACADRKRLAVVSSDDIDGTVYELTVTPSALKNLNEYVNELRRRNLPLEGVITKVSFDPNASYPLLVFSFAGILQQAQYESAYVVANSDEIKQITRTTPIPDVLPQLMAPAPQVALVAPAQQQFAPPPPAQQPQQQEPTGGFGKKRTRRTKAEMEAARAAEAGQQEAQPPQHSVIQGWGQAPQQAPQQAPWAPQQPQGGQTPPPMQQAAPQAPAFQAAAPFDAAAFEAELARRLGGGEAG